jgi:macrolide transport system ATP-binding/permease protein
MPDDPPRSGPPRDATTGTWTQHLRADLAGLRLSPAREAEIIEELSQHLDARYEELCTGGCSDAEARRLALEELAEPETLADHMRPLRQAHAERPIPPGSPRRFLPTDIWHDVRYATRALRRQPGFAAAAVITLALGIGANSAIFSVVNATLLQRLPVAARERLVYGYRGDVGGAFSYPLYAHLRDGNQVFDGLAAWGGITASLNAGDRAELVSGVIVTGNFFDVLGVRATRGRLLTSADDVTPGAHPVAVISHEFWQARFGGRADVVGRPIRLNGHVFTIVGVTPAGFPGPQIGTPRALYVPMMMQAIMRPPRQRYSGEQNPDLLNHRTNSWLFAVGRLKAGVGAERARQALGALMATYVKTLPQPAPPARIALVSVDEGQPGREQLQSVAWLLGGVVGTVLLIACANIANLLLSRNASRRRELAVRLAIGASRARIVRQLLTESVMLAAIGGVAGMALAWAAIEALDAAPPPAGALPLAVDLAIDQRVLLFSLALSIATGILFGVAPALQASRPGLVSALKDAAAEDERVAPFDLKKVLVVAEVGLSLLLLIAAGLFVRSLQSAQAIDPGFDAARLVSAPLTINLLRYTRVQGREFYRQVIDRIERIPGVESASLARVRLLGGTGRVVSIHVEGRGSSHERASSEGSGIVSGDLTLINANVTGPRFFRTVGVSLVAGRDFADPDIEGRPPVAIINETAARVHFPGENPIGQRLSVDGTDGPWREIVGVVRDSKYGTLGEHAARVVYLPLAQNHETGMVLYVRAAVPPASIVPSVRREIQVLEPNLPVPDIQTMTDTINLSLYPARMGAWLLGLFGGLALLLAAVGIYGVLSFSVARRTREMGIRLALGADARAVFRLVVRDGLLLAAIGIALGLAAGLAGGRWLASFLYGVSPSDAATFGVTIAILMAVALAACVVPARRAMRVEPIVALRYE